MRPRLLLPALCAVAVLLTGAPVGASTTSGPRPPATVAGPAVAAAPAPGVHVPRRFHVAPVRSGKADGSTWQDAGSLADVRNFVREAVGGDEVLLRSDAGPYRDGTVTVAHGGEPGRPVVLRGVDPSGRTSAPAVFQGTRANPWAEGLPKGSEVFKLMTGANHLVFEDMEFRDVGNGCFRLAGEDVTDVTIRRMRATNVIRFVQNERSSASHASVHDLEVSDVRVDRFSENVVKLKYDSSDVVIRDVHGDSQHHDQDFTMGVHLSGSTHDVLLDRVRMDNAQYSGKRYWNGDGFAAERGTYRLHFRDTYAGGNADAGYDLKADGVLMERAVAVGNTRNFRFWADDVVARDVVSVAPVRRGGSSSRHHLWVSPRRAAGGPARTGLPRGRGRHRGVPRARGPRAPVRRELAGRHRQRPPGDGRAAGAPAARRGPGRPGAVGGGRGEGRPGPRAALAPAHRELRGLRAPHALPPPDLPAPDLPPPALPPPDLLDEAGRDPGPQAVARRPGGARGRAQ